MNWTKKLIFPFISVVISSVIGIGVLELMFGSWIQHDQWKDADALNIVRDRKVIYSTEHLYGKSMPTVAYSRDRYGLRGGCKSPKNTAILTLGGSTTDQRYIADGQTYQDILARRFKDKNGKGICIANAGVDGHSTFGHLASL